MSIRTEKVAGEIKNKLNTAMSRDLSEISGLGLVTISKVLITPDLKTAKIYLTFLGNTEPVDVCLERINAKKKHIRFLLAKHIILRYMPDIDFYYDDTVEYADKIQKLLNTIVIPKDEEPEKSKDVNSDKSKN